MNVYMETEDNVKLKYTVWKSGKQTLLLLHGWGGNQASFTLLIKALEGDYTVISYDQRGFATRKNPIPLIV